MHREIEPTANDCLEQLALDEPVPLGSGVIADRVRADREGREAHDAVYVALAAALGCPLR
jgi:predicted nucleic acid-binding protein